MLNKILYLMIVSVLCFVTSGYADVENKGGQYASRTIPNGIKIQLLIDKTIIPAILNESKTSQALIDKLPYTLRLQRYSHGYCGSIGENLPYEKSSLHSGWLNGDIVYSKDSDDIAIPYKDEELSKDFYDGLVTLGVVTAPTLENLESHITITIALDE